MIHRRLLAAALGLAAALFLSACVIQFGNVEDEYSGYTKAGASEEARDAAVRECVFGRQGGGITGRVATSIRDIRIENCLETKGYHPG